MNTLHTNTPWRRCERRVCQANPFLLQLPSFTREDGPDKHSGVYGAEPVWQRGLAGVTRVFPVSLHPKGTRYPTRVCPAEHTLLHVCASVCVSMTSSRVCGRSSRVHSSHLFIRIYISQLWLTCPALCRQKAPVMLLCSPIL